jgi:uncharacterized protein YutE (UPF0331/DUF86 family)
MAKYNLNLSRIRDKVSDIKESLSVLQDYAKQDDEKFLGNKEAIRSARYAFIVLIEAATNIANHLCARMLNKAPTSYADSFFLLADNNILESTLAKRLGKMTGFRNLLVHGYGEVDNRVMLGIMRKDLHDLVLYLKEIAQLVEKSAGGDD